MITLVELIIKIIMRAKIDLYNKKEKYIENINKRNSNQRIQLNKLQEELNKEKEKNKELEELEQRIEQKVLDYRYVDMCEYCEKGKVICKENNSYLGIELYSGIRKLVAYGLDKKNWDISVSCNINYCPMCGRKLGE